MAERQRKLSSYVPARARCKVALVEGEAQLVEENCPLESYAIVGYVRKAP